MKVLVYHLSQRDTIHISDSAYGLFSESVCLFHFLWMVITMMIMMAKAMMMMTMPLIRYPTLPYDLKEGHRMKQREIFGHLPKAVRPTPVLEIMMMMRRMRRMASTVVMMMRVIMIMVTPQQYLFLDPRDILWN